MRRRRRRKSKGRGLTYPVASSHDCKKEGKGYCEGDFKGGLVRAGEDSGEGEVMVGKRREE